jgi:hypothetical protein
VSWVRDNQKMPVRPMPRARPEPSARAR